MAYIEAKLKAPARKSKSAVSEYMNVPESVRRGVPETYKKQDFVTFRLTEIANQHLDKSKDPSLSQDQRRHHNRKYLEYTEAAKTVDEQRGFERGDMYASLTTLEELDLPEDVVNFTRESYKMAERRIKKDKL